MTEIPFIYITPFWGPISSTLNNFIDDGVDAILLAAYCSGPVPRAIYPQIRRATSLRIPVFSIRQTQTDEWFTEWSDYKEELVPGAYEPEASALGVGLIPLQKDLVRVEEVMAGLNGICNKHSDYDSKVKAAREQFSSDRFNGVLDEVKKREWSLGLEGSYLSFKIKDLGKKVEGYWRK